VITSEGTLLLAFHRHPSAAVTENVPDPPSFVNVTFAGERS